MYHFLASVPRFKHESPALLQYTDWHVHFRHPGAHSHVHSQVRLPTRVRREDRPVRGHHPLFLPQRKNCTFFLISFISFYYSLFYFFRRKLTFNYGSVIATSLSSSEKKLYVVFDFLLLFADLFRFSVED